MNKKQKLFKIFRSNKGMTFLEMVVILSIFGTISGIVLFDYREFGSNVEMQNITNDIALRVVEAQRSAISGRLGGETSSIDYRPTYGVRFEYGAPYPDGRFIYYIDRISSRNFFFDPPTAGCPGGECISESLFKEGYGIARICFDRGTVCSFNKADVLFARPYPNAIIRVNPETGDDLAVTEYDDIQIEIKSPFDLTKTIIVWSTGQVEIRSGTIEDIF